MDAVSADQDIATRGVDVRAGTIEEVSGDTALILRECAEPAAGVNRLQPKPLLDGTVDHTLKATTVDRELRHVVASVDTAGFAPDLLAVTIEVIELIGADRDVVEILKQPEAGELTHRMRQRVDADAELADSVRLLKNFTTDAPRAQHQRRSETTDSATDDNRLHRPKLHSKHARQCS